MRWFWVDHFTEFGDRVLEMIILVVRLAQQAMGVQLGARRFLG